VPESKVASLAHSIVIPAGVPLYRVTSPSLWTKAKKHHRNVVNGRGSKANFFGGRYNYPGASAVYVTENVETCFAEMMFYFHRAYLPALDAFHLGTTPIVPVFTKSLVVWEILLKKDVAAIADLTMGTAGHFGVYPAMMKNPSQDYWHLKDRRAHVEGAGYLGIRAPSSRCTKRGRMVVFFNSQSNNLASIAPYPIELSLIQPSGAPFTNHAVHDLDFEAGNVVALANPMPRFLKPYAAPYRIQFHH
jgi:hypothetical protein